MVWDKEYEVEVRLWCEDVDAIKAIEHECGAPGIEISTRDGAAIGIFAYDQPQLAHLISWLTNALHDLGEEESGE